MGIVATNLVTNPSAELAVAPFAGSRTTLTRDNAQAKYGTWSYKLVVTDASAPSSLVSSATASLRFPVDASTAYPMLASVYSDVTTNYSMQLYEYDSAGTLILPVQSTPSVVVTAGAWKDISGTITTGPLTASSRVLVLRVASAVGATYWVDGLSLGSATYFDGSYVVTGPYKYEWTGAPHNSASIKSTSNNATDQLDAGAVSRRYLWFGNLSHQQWVPMPSAGMQVDQNFTTEYETLDNGGSSINRSKGYHKAYNFDFGVREAGGAEGLDVFSRYASGYYDAINPVSGTYIDPTQIWFCDPYTFDQNMLPPQWASPIIGAQSRGFHPIGVVNGIYGTGVNTRDLPVQSLEFNTSASATGALPNRLPTDERRYTTVILIPPTQSLHLGFTGSVIGAGAVIVRCHRRDGSDEFRTLASLIPDTSKNGLGTTVVNGSVYAWVQIGLGNTSGAPSAVRLAGAMAQLWNTGYTPDPATGQRHIPGSGHTGLRFGDAAIAESYVQVDPNSSAPRHLKGLSTTLVEVGAWL
jgi:hypothetical protein